MSFFDITDHNEGMMRATKATMVDTPPITYFPQGLVPKGLPLDSLSYLVKFFGLFSLKKSAQNYKTVGKSENLKKIRCEYLQKNTNKITKIL